MFSKFWKILLEKIYGICVKVKMKRQREREKEVIQARRDSVDVG